jgi:hypothetical protein
MRRLEGIPTTSNFRVVLYLAESYYLSLFRVYLRGLKPSTPTPTPYLQPAPCISCVRGIGKLQQFRMDDKHSFMMYVGR